MPGMMDTLLNLGLTTDGEALVKCPRPPFAYDSYRRFITMYSDVVLGFEHHHFETSSTLHRTARATRSTPS